MKKTNISIALLLLSSQFLFPATFFASEFNIQAGTKTNVSEIDTWLLNEMEGNQPFVNAIVRSYNKEFNSNLSEKEFTQNELNKMTRLSLVNDVHGGTLPDKFDSMPNLVEVEAFRIGISEIPKSIANLQNLESLNWNLNNIEEFPLFLIKLTKLKRLQINTGTIKEIPEEIYEMPQLISLDMRYQNLVRLPDDFFSHRWGNNDGSINILLAGNQVTTNVPTTYPYVGRFEFNSGNNLIGNIPVGYEPQDQLISTLKEPLTFNVGDDLSSLLPDSEILGLQSGRKLLDNHKFTYYAGESNPLITNNIFTSTGEGYIYIKSLYSEISNTHAKVKIPIRVNAVAGANVTIQYQDTNGATIAPNVVKTGNIGETYSSEQLAIDGYTFTEVTGNPTGTFTDTPQTVTYIYSKNSVVGADVTIQYQDTNGATIAPNVVKTGNIGEAYSSEQLAIDGYTFTEVTGNPTGTFTDTPQTVTYIYSKNPIIESEVTIQYQDTNGATIAPNIVKSGNIGDTYTSEQLVIDGYTFTKIIGTPTGAFTDMPQTVTYIYSKDLVVGADVTIQYKDANGTTIAPSIIKSGHIGDPYISEQLAIDGYTFKEVAGNPDGTFTDMPQTVTYIYSKDLVVGADVTIQYKDTDGATIAPSIIKSGHIGDPYTSEQLAIDGYTFKEVVGNPDGTFSDTSHTVTYIYSKNASQIKPIDPESTKTKPIDKTASISSISESTGKSLPKTGEISSPILTIAGTMTLLVSGAYLLSLNRKKSNK